MTKLSVVIVNYNTRDLLRDCLASLAASTQPAEVIVVDNASSDGSADMVAAEFPQVRLLAQPQNTWFCGGNNIGVEAASGEYVLLLNPDTVVMADTLAVMVNFMDANPDYSGATVQLRYPDGGIQCTCSRVPTYAYLLASHTPLGTMLPRWRGGLARRHWYEDENFNRTTSRDVAAMPGSCTLMRRKDLHLNPELLLYFPEDDLARRFDGHYFRFIAATYIIHHEKSATRSWLASRIYFRDLRVYVRTHHGTGAAWLMWLLTRPLWLGMWLKARLIRR
jgi:N-acetylglucosaminyl-diphospho-decaprenol L-rhamnosyltransferase